MLVWAALSWAYRRAAVSKAMFISRLKSQMFDLGAKLGVAKHLGATASA